MQAGRWGAGGWVGGFKGHTAGNPHVSPAPAADMHQEGGTWRYAFLYLDVEAPVPQQVRRAAPCCALLALNT